MSDIRKMVPVSEQTHARLTRLIGKEMMDGQRISFNEMVDKLISSYDASI